MSARAAVLAASRHEFPSRLEVCVVPSTVMSWAFGPSSRVRPCAQAIGVAGSPVVPTTTTGGAVGAEIGVAVAFTGGTGQ